MTQAALLIALFAGALAELWSPPPYRRWPLLTLAMMLVTGAVWAVTAARPDLFALGWLLVLGSMAERRFSRWAWLAIYLGGGLAAAVAAQAWPPQGAVHAAAGLALAGALCSDWRAGAGRWWRAGTGLAGLAAAAVLVFADDSRGIGFLVGLAIGFVLVARSAAREREIAAANDNVVVFVPGSDSYH